MNPNNPSFIPFINSKMEDKRWAGVNRLFTRASPFGNETGKLPNGYFSPGKDILRNLRADVKVLVVGAGGLGCELLKVID